MPTDPAIVLLRPGGPMVLRGTIEVRRTDGTVITRDRDVALCRCGQSARKPFCDGTHKTLPREGG